MRAILTNQKSMIEASLGLFGWFQLNSIKESQKHIKEHINASGFGSSQKSFENLPRQSLKCCVQIWSWLSGPPLVGLFR